jgi:hypothetical protein
MTIVLSPAMRYAVVGKTGSGKTVASVALASLLVPPDDPHWQVWWLDSKNDKRDGDMLRRWGYGRRDCPARRIIRLRGDVVGQAQYACYDALENRRNVLIVADEYKHIVESNRRAGYGIEGVHVRGRGLNVGIIGQTQEPVDIPRQLLSQAAHVFLFDISYPRDVKYLRDLFSDYQRPPDPHGFFHAYVDGDAEWRYYPHINAWHDMVRRATEPEMVKAG